MAKEFSNVISPETYYDRTGIGGAGIKDVVAEHKVTRNSKSRGNWLIGWCPKTDCMRRDTSFCDRCIRFSMFKNRVSVEDVET